MKKILSDCNRILSQAENISIGIALLASTLMITINVIMRFIFKNAFSWSDEMVRYLIIYVTFVGCAGCVRRREHIAIDILSGTIKNKAVLRVINILITLICLVFSAMIFSFSIKLVGHAIHYPQQTAGMRIPQFIPYLMIPLGFFLMTLRYLQDLVGKIRGADVFAGDSGKPQPVNEPGEGGSAL